MPIIKYASFYFLVNYRLSGKFSEQRISRDVEANRELVTSVAIS